MRDPTERAEAEPSPEHGVGNAGEAWPRLPYEEWKETYETLHMWTQIVGKIRLTLSPMINHWWNVTLYVTPRGLTTSTIPYAANHGVKTFEIEFDFIDHSLAVHTSEGATRYMSLHPRTVADFYRELMSILHSLGIKVKINTTPQEVPNPIACDVDTQHASYDEEYANRFWSILVLSDNVFKEFRGDFIGKCSPVHFFWGSFDLAVTRFSGRRAPEKPKADHIQREAYSHECISAGFWPGSGSLLAPAYYAYASPAPEGISKAQVGPDDAHFDKKMGEFILLYDDVRNAADPRAALLDFLQTTYAASADLAGWDRPSLERQRA
ncbi:MAG: DUF5996 family protein [Chloroflexota bacterium]